MTGRRVAELVNAKHDTNVQDRSILKQVSEGKAGISPWRRGPKGTIGSRRHKALFEAFESCVKPKQVTRDSDSKQTFLQKLVNAVANKHPDENRTGQTLFEQLQNSFAELHETKTSHKKFEFEANVPEKIDQCCCKQASRRESNRPNVV
jgi:hypothetical protein